MTLKEAKINEEVKIVNILFEDSIKQQFARMGIIKNTLVTIKRVAPFGDPIEINLRGYNLMIRKQDADKIIIEE